MLNKLQVLTQIIFSLLIGLEAKIKDDGPWTGYDYYNYESFYWIENGVPKFWNDTDI